MYNYACYGAYYPNVRSIWKKFTQEIEKSYYLYKHMKDTQHEQQLMWLGKKLSTVMPKFLMVLQVFQPNKHQSTNGV